VCSLCVATSSSTVDGCASSDAYKTATIALAVILGIAIVIIILLIVYIVYLLSDKGMHVELAFSSTIPTELVYYMCIIRIHGKTATAISTIAGTLPFFTTAFFRLSRPIASGL